MLLHAEVTQMHWQSMLGQESHFCGFRFSGLGCPCCTSVVAMCVVLLITNDPLITEPKSYQCHLKASKQYITVDTVWQ